MSVWACAWTRETSKCLRVRACDCACMCTCAGDSATMCGRDSIFMSEEGGGGGLTCLCCACVCAQGVLTCEGVCA